MIFHSNRYYKMDKFIIKGKVTCVARSDGSVIASWFKEIELEAFTKAEALEMARAKIRAEYDDATVESQMELEVVGHTEAESLLPSETAKGPASGFLTATPKPNDTSTESTQDIEGKKPRFRI